MENILITDKHVLLYLSKIHDEYIINNFCGKVYTNLDDFKFDKDSLIYICGNIKEIYEKIKFNNKELIYVIKELSKNYDENDNIINIGEVPINIYGLGIYFRKMFDSNKNYFDLINKEHKFQSLTESNKQSNAFRKGIYLSNVDEEFRFNLLRCSTNLDGPTENFCETDREIINKVNNISEYFFKEKIELNHVLAQIYTNKLENGVEKKAKIKDHSDKTKDMPRNGLIAFCTFYDKIDSKLSQDDPFDYRYKNASVLTKLSFRLKDKYKNYIKKFEIILYPNSVFIIPLSTNRLYTHEIIPSVLPIDKLPTRLGYVIRCSKTKAIYKDNDVYINDNIKLEEPNEEDIKELKEIYLMENMSDELIFYDKSFNFSLNKGDYLKPINHFHSM